MIVELELLELSDPRGTLCIYINKIYYNTSRYTNTRRILCCTGKCTT